MSPVAPEDSQLISHIKFICERIHDFGDDLYEDMMDRDHEQARKKAKELKEVLSDFIQSLSDEI